MRGVANAEDFEIGVGVELLGTIGDLNLGEQVGAESDGESDLIGRELGLVASAAIGSGPLRIGGEVSLGIGGLNLGRIEEHYYSSTGGQLGSSGVATAALAIRYRHELGHSWTPVFGGRAGMGRMWATSPAGGAHLDVIFLEPQFGISVATGARGSVVAMVGFRIERVVRASLSSVSDGFVRPEDPALMLSPRIVLGYEYRF